MPKRKRSPPKIEECAHGTQSQTSHPPSKPHSPESNPDPQEQEEQPPTKLTVPFPNKNPIPCSLHGDADKPPSLLFTHGAGGGITAPATRAFAAGFASLSPVLCFQGNLNLTSRVGMFRAVVEHFGRGKTAAPAALGGRSMGARAAVLAALEMRVGGEKLSKALVLVSYPLLAAGGRREVERRERILIDLPEEVDVLFIVGSRDVQCDLGGLEKVRAGMTGRSWLVEVKGADHGMSCREKDGTGPLRVETGLVAARWLMERDRDKRLCEMSWDQEERRVVCSAWSDGF